MRSLKRPFVDPPTAYSKTATTSHESGAALLTVLSVLAILLVIVDFFVYRNVGRFKTVRLEIDKAQAYYLAESGIAWQLYLESLPKDSIPKDSLADNFENEDEADTLVFRLSPKLEHPSITVGSSISFLEIFSEGKQGEQSHALFGQFGLSPNDSLYGAALTLTDRQIPLKVPSLQSIQGAIRSGIAPEGGLKADPLPEEFSLLPILESLEKNHCGALRSTLKDRLLTERPYSGNARFTPSNPPPLSAEKDIVYNLGSISLQNMAHEIWVLRGPGRLFADADIRVRGNIRLENIELFAGGNVIFEDSISGENITAYAGGALVIADKSHLSLQGAAEKEIQLRQRAQTGIRSLLYLCKESARDSLKQKKEKLVPAIRLDGESVARGVVVASGPQSRIVLATADNRIEGIALTDGEFWSWGQVYGSVLARILRCGADVTKNCLGGGSLNWFARPRDLVLPLEFAPEQGRVSYKLMLWKSQ